MYPVFYLTIHAVDGMTIYSVQTDDRTVARAFLDALDHEGSTIVLRIADMLDQTRCTDLQDEAVYHYLDRPIRHH